LARYLFFMAAKQEVTKEPSPAAATEKPTLHLAGPSKGLPTVIDIAALMKALTGKDSSPEDLKECQKILDAIPPENR
jgi:hypothetical protein